MKASRENIGVSHLFFADDLMFFAKVGEKGNEAIKKVLDKFCEDSGQVVRFEKSKIYFSPNVPSSLKEKVCNNLGTQVTSSLVITWDSPRGIEGPPGANSILLWKGCSLSLLDGRQSFCPLQEGLCW